MASYRRPCPTVLLVEDHRAVREALAQLLDDGGFTVCAQAGDKEEALAQLADHAPDVALVDLSLGEDDGFALLSELQRLGIPVVVCSSHEDVTRVQRALDLGARAYVAKRDAARTLVRTVQDVLDGWVLVSPHAAEELPLAGVRSRTGTMMASNPTKPNKVP